MLKLADGLRLPLDVVTEKLAFLGRTGTGKTYAAMKLAEEMLTAGAQIIALDAVGKWYGLRVAGAGPGFSIPVFGGLNGDFPLESTGGKLMADLLVDRAISAVLDVSQFTKSEQTRFALDFATHFYQRKKASPSAVHIFLEECQEFVPQNAMPGEQAMLSAYERLWKLGRNFGIGGSLISQRPQEINKKALNQTGTLFVFGMTGPQERKAIEQWVSAQGINEDIGAILPTLKQGEPHVWSPTFLNVSKTVRIAQKQSADVSSTPKVGTRAKEKPLTPIDAAQLTKEMAATVERAKADDPRELRRQIAELRKQLVTATTQVVSKNSQLPTPKVVEVPVLKDAQIARLEKVYERMLEKAQHYGEAMALLWDQQADEAKALLDVLRVVTNVPKPPPAAVMAFRPGREAVAPVRPPKPRPAGSTPATVASSNGNLDGAQQKILDVVAMLDVRGLTPNREMVARWLSIHPNGGRYGSNLARLREEGYLEGFTLTDKGVVASGDIRPCIGLDGAKAPLDGAQRAIIEILDQYRTARFTRESLAEKLGLHPNGGRYGSNLARLRTMGLIPERGDIYLTEEAYR